MLAASLAFVARLALILLFLPFSAADKVMNYSQAVQQASRAAPGAALPRLLIAGGFCIEVFMSLGVLSGVMDRLCALVLALYCIATALMWKQFWREADFRLKGASHGREVFWDFLKNIAVAGGFLVLAFGATAFDAAQFLRAPFASSHPYATAGRP